MAADKYDSNLQMMIKMSIFIKSNAVLTVNAFKNVFQRRLDMDAMEVPFYPSRFLIYRNKTTSLKVSSCL